MRPHLKLGVSTIALAAVSALGASAALAQVEGASEQVVVTGTSIRGAVAPVGSNLITLGADEIKNTAPVTVTEALANVPAITGMNNSGRGQNGNGGAGASVYIHQIGASAQNATLVLMDGHRIPQAGSGNGNPVTDPNIIPQPMLQRVEVLADGSSSIYGSDAVAGVVNFITRKKFDGLEIHYEARDADSAALGHYLGIITGKTWENAGFIGAFTYSYEGNIKNSSRWKTNPLAQPGLAIANGIVGTTGGTTSFGTFFCSPATINPSGSSLIFLSPTATSGVANNAVNAPCSTWNATDYLPRETRMNAMIRFTEDLADNLHLTVDGLWERKAAVSRVSRGNLQATVYGAGGPINVTVGSNAPVAVNLANPFFTMLPGSTATKQTIRYNFDELLGPGATTSSGDDELIGTADLVWDINDKWSVDLMINAGRSDSYVNQTKGVVNTGQATLAINGTNQQGGSIPTGSATSTAVPTTSTILFQSLTAANALDVWNPAATNRTSAAVKAALLDPFANLNMNRGVNSHQQFRLITNGELFDMPAGPLKVAFGVEQYNLELYNTVVVPQNAGPSRVSSQFNSYNFFRRVTSEFAETIVPVVSPEMNIPLVNKFEVNLSVRHDGYSDVGQTTNPKAALNWDIIEGLRFRASWSTSFVAVALEHDLQGGMVGNSAVTSGTPGSLPVALYPQVTQLGIAGCTAASVTCDTSSLQGINSSGASASLVPERGRGWTIGLDFNPDFLPGFTSNVSWWHVTYLGGATAATPQIDAFNPLLNNRIQLFPGCATPAQIAALIGPTPVNSIIPACVSTFTNTATSNLINFWASGIDLALGYRFDTDYGSFAIDDSIAYQTTFLQGFGTTVPPAQYRFEVRNTSGLNTTFPNIGTQMRAHVGWALDPFTADFYMNYVGAYKNVSASATTLIGNTAFFVYNGTGGDHVESQATFDMRLAYVFDTPMTGQDEVSLTVKNLFNSSPPFFNGNQGSNGTTGFNAYVSNAIGRIISVGLDAKF